MAAVVCRRRAACATERSRQPKKRFRHGRAGVRSHPVRHGCRDQHRTLAQEKADIAQNAIDLARSLGIETPRWPSCRPWKWSTGHQLDDRCRAAVQDGRIGARSAGLCWTGRLRSTMRSAKSQPDPRAFTRRSRVARHSARAEHRSRQHAGQQLQYFARRGQCRHRARRARAGDPDEPCRERAHALGSAAVAKLVVHARRRGDTPLK